MPHPPLERFTLSKIFRQSCTRCGSRSLIWCTASESADHLGRRQARELLRAMPPSLRRDAEVWVCTRCGEAGAFGPPEFC